MRSGLARVLALASIALLAGRAAADEVAPAAPVAPPPVRDLGASGPSVAERLAVIRDRVQAVAVYPPVARAQGVEGEAQVGFAIDARGAPTGIAVERSSGSLALDRAAAQAVASVDALPYVVGRIIVPVRFTLGVSSTRDPITAPPGD